MTPDDDIEKRPKTLPPRSQATDTFSSLYTQLPIQIHYIHYYKNNSMNVKYVCISMFISYIGDTNVQIQLYYIIADTNVADTVTCRRLYG